MGRDLLDTKLSILCTESERTAVALQVVVLAHPWLLRFGLDPAATSAELSALAAKARSLASELGMYENYLTAAKEEAEELAVAYYASQSLARAQLRAIVTLHAGPVRLTAEVHARNYRLKAPRVPGSVEQANRVLKDLEGASAILRTVPPGELLYQEAVAWERRLNEAFCARAKAELDVTLAAEPVRLARLSLMEALHKVRVVWETGRVFSKNGYPDLIFELALAEAARKRSAKVPRRGGADAGADDEDCEVRTDASRSDVDGELIR